MQVREATSEDVIGIVYVQATTWIATYPNDEYGITETDIRAIDWHGRIPGWQHMVKSTDYKVYVAIDNEGLVRGFASLTTEGEYWRVQHMYVLPDDQGRGIGRQLFERIQADVNDTLVLDVAVYNRSAMGFYERLGFVPTGIRGERRLPGDKSIPTIEAKYKPGETVENEKNYVNRARLARLLGERDSTIKWYTELGLLPYRQHEAGRRRYYDVKTARERIEKIRYLQKQGMSLDSIRRRW